MILDEQEAWQHYASDGAEALREIEASLLVLEDEPDDASCINRLYRGMHTLMGNSGFMGLASIESLAHVAEDLIGLVRDQHVPLKPEMVDLLLAVVDRLRGLVEAAGRDRRDAPESEVSPLVQRLRGALVEAEGGGGPAAAAAVSEPVVKEVEVSAAVEPPAAVDSVDSIDSIDPGEEAGYVEVFLALAAETLPELNATIARLRADAEVISLQDRLAELCTDFAFAAERMGYQPLVDLLQRMARAAAGGSAEIDSIGALELQLYGWLAGVEDRYRAMPGADAGAARTITRTYEAACAGMAFGDLARLRTVLDDPRQLDGDEVSAVFDRLRAACRHYGFEGASRSCLDHFDQLSRACESGSAPPADLIARLGEFITQLGETIHAVNAGSDVADVEAATPLVPNEMDSVIDALPLSPALRPHLTAESREQIPSLLARRWRLFEIYADLERDAVLCERLPAWIGGREVACLSSTVVPSAAGKGCYAYLFLLAAPSTLEELHATFASWQTPPNLLRLTEVSPTGRHPSTSDPELARVPVPVPVPVPASTPDSPPPPAPPTPSRASTSPPPPPPPTDPAPRDPDADPAAKVEFLRIDARKVSLIMDLAGELGLASGAVTHHPDLAGRDLEGFSAAAHKLEMLIRELQNEVSAMRLVPVAGVFHRMRRVVRDVSRRTGKKVELTLIGEETEIDKLMVDSLGDPLVHMLRNSIDHGIERPEEREAAGKPAAGRIVLEAAHQGGEVTVKVSDDGRGLDRERILARARERGLLPEGRQLSDEEILELVFLPGFSTKDQVDELSGRGVGMDVIKTVIEGMRGHVRIRSTPGRGTSISLTVPLTLAFIEAMVVRERERLFAVPIEKVFEVFKVAADRVAHSSADGSSAIRVRNSLVPVCWLHRYYGESGPEDGSAEAIADRVVVVVQTSRGSLAIPVDALLGNQQLMLKPLRGILAGVRGAAGCGVLRTGDVALAIDCEQLHA